MSERTGPLSLDADLSRVLDSGDFLLGLDFDGTLAPIVEHPDLAVPDPRAVDLIAELASRDAIEVAVISGRARSDLQARLGDVKGVVLVGEHGNDMGGATVPNKVISEAETFIRQLAAEAGGATVEVKPNSVTFHYRHLEDEQAEPFLDRIREWARSREEIRLLEGKKVIELTTATSDKGDAIKELAGGRPIVYLGDDVTDETVFEVLGPEDVGIKVGEGPTGAPHRVEHVDEVVRILETIALASR
ncbi:MAG: trehalose-phosphatase [Actinomycetota bacterium]